MTSRWDLAHGKFFVLGGVAMKVPTGPEFDGEFLQDNHAAGQAMTESTGSMTEGAGQAIEESSSFLDTLGKAWDWLTDWL